jgi:hypothetical protein
MRKLVAGFGVAAALALGVACSGGSSYASCLDATEKYLDEVMATETYEELEAVAADHGIPLDGQQDQGIQEILPECKDLTADEEKRLGDEVSGRTGEALGHIIELSMEHVFTDPSVWEASP